MLFDSINQEALNKICQDFKIKFLVMFGSQASGSTHQGSDLDIAVYPEDGLANSEAKLEQKLAKLFNHPEIDLVNLKKAGPLLQKEVAVNGRVLYAQHEDSFLLFQMYAVRAYYDFAPYLRLREQLIQERLKNLSS